MFGNPGTVEQGFLDALADYPEMRYVLTLHETVAVMAGDGFARPAQHGIGQIHSTPGLGNAIGALYQANRGHAPLVIIGGVPVSGYVPISADVWRPGRHGTAGDQMVHDGHRPELAAADDQRAIKVASTPPMGPVYVCLPTDILNAPAVEPRDPDSRPSTRSAPTTAGSTRWRRMLAAANGR